MIIQINFAWNYHNGFKGVDDNVYDGQMSDAKRFQKFTWLTWNNSSNNSCL